jgi:hypothetical protein
VPAPKTPETTASPEAFKTKSQQSAMEFLDAIFDKSSSVPAKESQF